MSVTKQNFKGTGCITEFVQEWNKVFSAISEPRVDQEDYIGRETLLSLSESRLTIEF